MRVLSHVDRSRTRKKSRISSQLSHIQKTRLPRTTTSRIFLVEYSHLPLQTDDIQIIMECVVIASVHMAEVNER